MRVHCFPMGSFSPSLIDTTRSFGESSKGIRVSQPAPATLPVISTEGLREMKRGAAAVFSMGDYRKIAMQLDDASSRVISACEIGPGQELLDVAAGNGNAAIRAARRGARVVACDLTPAMIRWGRDRCEAEGVDVRWVRGDAEDLPFGSGRFDCATSVFGASMTPRPTTAAAEIFRVVRPGGLVGMASWALDGLAARLGEILTRGLGMGAGRPESPWRWGDEAGVRALLEPWADKTLLRRAKIRSKFKSFEHYREFKEANFGILIAAKKKMAPGRYEEMIKEIRELALSSNVSPNGALWIDSEYLLVMARKKAEGGL